MGKLKAKRLTLLAGLAVVAILLTAAFVYRHEIREWYLLSRDFERLGLNAQGYSEYRHRKTRIVFVRLPAGAFWMGSPEAERQLFIAQGGSDPNRTIRQYTEREHPRHPVKLSPFFIAKYEVSQAQWKKVMGNNRSDFMGDNLPVHQVSWNDCQKFCQRTGLSLPTEAQWEYACRAETETSFAFGTTLSKNQANFNNRTTVPVDSFQPNGFGLHNMHGNVAELCQDSSDAKFYSKPEASILDPACRASSPWKVRRGGHWKYGADICRSACRSRSQPRGRSDEQGLRPVYTLHAGR